MIGCVLTAEMDSVVQKSLAADGRNHALRSAGFSVAFGAVEAGGGAFEAGRGRGLRAEPDKDMVAERTGGRGKGLLYDMAATVLRLQLAGYHMRHTLQFCT